MKNIHYYFLSLNGLDFERILSEWRWLIRDEVEIIAITKAGDLLIKNAEGYLQWVDVGVGEVKTVSNNYLDFENNELDNDLIQEIILADLVDELESYYGKLELGKIFSYTLLPILGGNYNKENMYSLDIYEHFSLIGEMQNKIKDLPDGTHVQIKVTE